MENQGVYNAQAGQYAHKKQYFIKEIMEFALLGIKFIEQLFF